MQLSKHYMLNVFFSWYDGQEHHLAQELFTLLKERGFVVVHSPYSPHSGYDDERWKNWYAEGLPNAVREADIFVAVITPTCAGSSWMWVECLEAETSYRRTGKPDLYYIRFDSADEPVSYPSRYLEISIELPSDPVAALQMLVNGSKN